MVGKTHPARGHAPDPTIRLFRVTKSFATASGRETVFKEFALNIEKGQTVSVLGASGCGKTTLLSLIAGIETPDSGEVRVGGRRIGYMFQTDRLIPWRNAKSNALLGVEMGGGCPSSESLSRLSEYFENMGLKGIERKYPQALSGGMRQRIALIRTLLYDPDVLLLDEPFSALDYESKLSLEAEVLQFVRDKCGTMVFVTHDIDEAIAVGHRLVVLEGRPAAGRPAGIVLDKDVTFVSDRAGRDPAVVRQDPAFANYFRAIWSALRDEQA